MADRPSDRQKQRIVIAGQGHAAWMTAAVLAKTVPAQDYSITVAGDREAPGENAGHAVEPFGLADATLPSADHFSNALTLDEDGIVNDAGGSFSYGIAMSGWAEPQSSYFHPFGSIGAALGPVAFQHIAMRLRGEGMAVRFANYSLAALAAQAGKFARPGNDPRSVLSTCRHGVHLGLESLAEMQRHEALSAAVAYVPGPLQGVEFKDDGNISAIVMAGGARIEGDLFFDCTGIESRLMGEMADVRWQDWSEWLACDHLVSAIIDTADAPPPYSHAVAHDGGWIRHLPLQGRTVLNCIYRQEFIDEREAVRRLLQSCAGRQPGTVNSGPVSFGRYADAWRHNCIAIGASAALIDPVAVSNLQLLRAGIGRFLKLLPGKHDGAAVRAEYNRQMALLLDNARDFAMLHYKLNGRNGEPFWDACRQMRVPEALEYKLRLYESNGLIALYDEEPLEETSWLNLWDEHGIRPRNYSPVADGFRPEDLHKHLQRVREVMMSTLQQMPSHAQYLAWMKGRNRTGPDAGPEN